MNDVSFLTNNGVNVKASLDIFGDMDTYNESLGDFLEEIDGKLQKIKDYESVNDMANYAILVHSLKSDAKYFGFEVLAEMAYKHELESKAKNDVFVHENFNALVVESNRIVAMVKQYLGRESMFMQQTEAPAPAPAVSVPAPMPVQSTEDAKTILVVDDSNIVRTFLTKLLDESFTILMANDGEEAINIVSQNSDKIWGMLLDLNMPNVDGFAVLAYLKDNDLFKKIPVTIVTGNDSRELDEKAFGYPIIDMLKKPFNERDVLRIIERTKLFH